MLAIELVFCFVVYYYSMGANKLINMFKDAAGIWQIDRWRPLTAAFVNLGLNLITVRWLGMYGVLLSSIVSIVLIQIPWLFHNLFREVFPRQSMWNVVCLRAVHNECVVNTLCKCRRKLCYTESVLPCFIWEKSCVQGQPVAIKGHVPVPGREQAGLGSIKERKTKV